MRELIVVPKEKLVQILEVVREARRALRGEQD